MAAKTPFATRRVSLLHVFPAPPEPSDLPDLNPDGRALQSAGATIYRRSERRRNAAVRTIFAAKLIAFNLPR